ncbi:Rieske 2Fe-2S domain-containing protein [Sphingomonas sp. G-3-2-10]|uniref:Rieske 2Fe-2S domain-containing protein n=1 Tax=Sphingomonas sp. G-3-2-10 TaxID=2728838 RepID=UPI00146B5C80|nr:Rieske 2Fe-2S domain-containing protein [Sphingomonas sp. G-3-2-10]
MTYQQAIEPEYPKPLTHQENEDLARVGPGTVMGEYLRRFWHPVVRAAKLEPNGAPVRIRLLGELFVTYRTKSNRIGFLRERCPHRGASLALAHNSGEGLRCLFHGWKIGVGGKVEQVPTEPPACAAKFAEGVKVRHYPVREAGGLIWAFVGEGIEPPEFPDYEFNSLPEDQIDIRVGLFHCNWVQGMEAVLDSAHLGQLHRSSFKETFFTGGKEVREAQVQRLIEAPAPSFEFDVTPFGFREAAIRDLSDGRKQGNLRMFAAPYYSFLPGSSRQSDDRTICISVPFDDEWAAQYFLTYNTHQPIDQQASKERWRYTDPDPDNFAAGLGDVSNLWGQNRDAMQAGHATGFIGRHSFHEDFIIQESMGPITDRTQDNLGSSDTIIDLTRRTLLKAAYALRDGSTEIWGQKSAGDFDYAGIRGNARVIPANTDWRDIDPFEDVEPVFLATS